MGQLVLGNPQSGMHRSLKYTKKRMYTLKRQKYKEYETGKQIGTTW